MIKNGKRGHNKTLLSPKVSIITVTYNAEIHLQVFLNNVKKFLNDDVELIIIDGDSNDGTIDILNNNNHTIDYWESEPDKGIYDAMNKAITFANGRWLYFLGVDDQILDGFKNMVDLLSENNTIYFGNTLYTGIEIKNKISKYSLTKFIVCHQGIFYPAKVFTKYKYETKYKVSADHYLNILCFTDNNFCWQYHDLLIANYAPGGFSSTIVDETFKKDYGKIIRKNLGYTSYFRYQFRLIKQFFKVKNVS